MKSGLKPFRSVTSGPLLAAVLVCAAVVTTLVRIEDQKLLAAELAAIVIASLAATKMGIVDMVEASARRHPWTGRAGITLATLAVVFVLREDTFGLLMLATVLLYVTTCIGVTIQMGYAGVTNFSAAAFVGTGAYTAALLDARHLLPDLLILLSGGVVAVAIGSLLLLPVLRTRGHYAALITLAFGVMFNVFLDASDSLGGPQGLKLGGINLLSWDFSNDLHLFGYEFSFYVNYVLLASAVASLAMLLAAILDKSWIGIWLDAVRLDETTSAVFGLNIGRWKILAFTIGNFLAGIAGAIYAKMAGFIAPNNFALSDSLIIVSIVILGGIGNRWGVFPAALIVILLPEKLQFIQEYRLLLYAALVIAILIARPGGLLERRTRRFDFAQT
jgi:ABC-type branched-subunit amino acid transport system permease subunit